MALPHIRSAVIDSTIQQVPFSLPARTTQPYLFSVSSAALQNRKEDQAFGSVIYKDQKGEQEVKPGPCGDDEEFGAQALVNERPATVLRRVQRDLRRGVQFVGPEALPHATDRLISSRAMQPKM